MQQQEQETENTEERWVILLLTLQRMIHDVMFISSVWKTFTVCLLLSVFYMYILANVSSLSDRWPHRGDWKRGSGKRSTVENAGVENVGVENVAPISGVENETREWKTWHHVAGLENAGVSDSDQW